MDLTKVNELINGAVAAKANTIRPVDVPKIPGRVIAHYVPQAWVDDYAVEVDDGHRYYDITEVVMEIGREASLQIRDDRNESDNLIPHELQDHHTGPYRVEVEVQISEFWEERPG
jgi:hypothetical protein